MIKKINISLTNRCDCQCLYCDIWQKKPKSDISLNILLGILRSPLLHKDADLALTGGEPFLHPRFFSLAKTVLRARPRSMHTISTNGTHPEEMISFLTIFGILLPANFCFHVSFDGLHASRITRGIDGRLILDNLCAVKRIFPKVPIKLKFTITSLNHKDMRHSWKEARKKGWPITFKLAETARHYTNSLERPNIPAFTANAKKHLIDDLAAIIKELPARDPQAVFLKKIIAWLMGRLPNEVCRVPFERIFVMHDGLVFSCLHKNPVGDLKKQALGEIWVSSQMRSMRADILKDGCNNCLAFHGRSS